VLTPLAIGFFAFLKSKNKWPFVAIALYALFVVVVFMPFVWFVATCLGQTGWPRFGQIGNVYEDVYESWPFWVFCAVLVICQLCLLIIPVRVTNERPRPQRSVWVTAIAAAVLMAVVIAGIILSIMAAVRGDDIPEPLALVFLVAVGVSWLVWLIIFRLFARNTEPKNFICRTVKYLFRGSILELLVAVPSHIIVRQKDVCCAHMLTAAGLATGLAVMLISFGPGIYFLYAERIKAKSNNKTKNQNEGDIPE
jgi:hypothetical protein